jgi:hypothetical protein
MAQESPTSAEKISAESTFQHFLAMFLQEILEGGNLHPILLALTCIPA